MSERLTATTFLQLIQTKAAFGARALLIEGDHSVNGLIGKSDFKIDLKAPEKFKDVTNDNSV